MKTKFNLIVAAILLLVLFSDSSYSQTEGFNVKTPIQKIADSTSKFLKEIINQSSRQPKESIPEDLVCSSECFLIIPEIEMVQSRGDFTGTGLMSCKAPNSNEFTEPLYYKINNLKSFDESGGGLVILATNKTGMKAILGDNVHLNSDNISAGPIGTIGDNKIQSFVAYEKYTDQRLSGANLSESLLEYSSKDTFNAYQGTIVPIEILASPQDVPPVLREFNSLLLKWTEECK
ncbi:MAG: hypothetical protein DHS20C13_09210 [Thermodesulfobacteriota bacterium]|nr:MAG: hypothetical protein DHS20C13_09210 [Thermodesulfobacteriota bacterium]